MPRKGNKKGGGKKKIHNNPKSQSNKLKEKGNVSYMNNNYETAIYFYSKGIKLEKYNYKPY